MRARSVSCTSLRANQLTDGTSRAARALALLAAIVSIAFSVVAPPSPRGGAAPLSSWSSVIIRAETGALVQAEHSVVLAGGTVGSALPIVGGFAARVPSRKIADLSRLAAVKSIIEDGSASFHSDYDPSADPYSLASAANGLGAAQAWSAGVTGAGVDVALIDSGVTPVEGLAGSGKLIAGPDFSMESPSPNLAHLDAFGHGTFMAGLIAGRDSAANPLNPGSGYLGIAPDARIVNVKVGASNGTVQVSQIILAIGWVVTHRHDNGMNIRVLNLSVGSHSVLDYKNDPLSLAAQAAWQSGVVVVAAAGNEGSTSQRLSTPAFNPAVIAAGAETAQSYDSLLGATVANFSNSGDGVRNPDVLAPGAHMQGLRVPGSYIDQHFPTAVLGTRFFRGSGTSEATAVTSGAVALLLQKRPELRPDDVKALLLHGAAPLPNLGAARVGSGLLQLASPLAGTAGAEAHNVTQQNGDSNETGYPSQWNNANWNGSWNGTTWTGTTWTGTTWTGTTWTGTTWTGTTWTGTTWTGTTWTGTTWTGTTWTGTTWTNLVWAGFWGP